MSGLIEELIEQRLGPATEQDCKDFEKFKIERKYHGLSSESLAIRQSIQKPKTSPKVEDQVPSDRVIQVALPDLSGVPQIKLEVSLEVDPEPVMVKDNSVRVERVVRPRPHQPGVPAPSPVPKEMFAKEEPEDKDHTPANLLL